MEFNWEAFLDRHRDYIVSEWKKRLRSTVSDRYARRSSPELSATTTQACDAFCRVLARDDFGPINDFINKITRIRLEAGFPLTDVQKAFELFRRIVIPLLVEASPPGVLCRNIEAVNDCLAYTIHRFSSHFQKKHETHLKEHARLLEKEVAERTSELRDSEHQYKSLVEGISDGYLVLSGDTIAFVNQAFCQMHGVGEPDILLRSFLDFVAEESKGMVVRTMADSGDRTVEAFEYQRMTADGQSLPTEINFRPTRFRDQDYDLCIVRDITRRKAMEKKSREMERMAYIGKLTASLSHEIRNPLSSVKMNLQILGKNNRFTGNDQRRLDITQREIRRLEGILQELLDFAKPVTVRPGDLDIHAVIRSCVELLDGKLRKKQVTCKIRHDPRLADIRADRGKVEQLLINLLLNALDSVDTEGRIEVSTARTERDGTAFARIRVADDGHGISEDRLPHIFDAFYTTKASGTGLGLANVRRIAEAHKGHVAAANRPGGGAAVDLFLPMGG